MKTNHFVKKYKLSLGTNFDHQQFAIDFGYEFKARLELYQSFGNWSHARFLELMDVMKSRWDNINNKTMGNLPDKLWDFIYYNILITTKSDTFPEIAAIERMIDDMDVHDLKDYLRDKCGLTWINDHILDESAMEWDHHVNDKAVGELSIRPNYALTLLESKVYGSSDYLGTYAFEELWYQLNKIGHAKAKIQFKMHHEYRKREKERERFDWSDFVYRNMSGFFSVDEYLPYFKVLGFNKIDTLTNNDMMKSFRLLSMKHHPDKGGDTEKFIELVEAKNKCVEYFYIKNK